MGMMMNMMGMMMNMMQTQMKGGGGGCGATGYTGPPVTPEEVDAFLGQFPLDEKAIIKLKSLDPYKQKEVLNKGSLASARDPTAVLISRCSQASSGTLVPGDGSYDPSRAKPGDWNCPNCGDQNFARNSACRMCGTPKPQLEQAVKMVLPADPMEVQAFVRNIP